MQESFWWWLCSDKYIISLSPHLHTPPFSSSLISLMVSVDIEHRIYLLSLDNKVDTDPYITEKLRPLAKKVVTDP